MKKARTITDLDKAFRLCVTKLTQEYDYQRLQAQTYADYMIALVMSYEDERARISGW